MTLKTSHFFDLCCRPLSVFLRNENKLCTKWLDSIFVNTHDAVVDFCWGLLRTHAQMDTVWSHARNTDRTQAATAQCCHWLIWRLCMFALFWHPCLVTVPVIFVKHSPHYIPFPITLRGVGVDFVLYAGRVHCQKWQHRFACVREDVARFFVCNIGKQILVFMHSVLNCSQWKHFSFVTNRDE